MGNCRRMRRATIIVEPKRILLRMNRLRSPDVQSLPHAKLSSAMASH